MRYKKRMINLLIHPGDDYMQQLRDKMNLIVNDLDHTILLKKNDKIIANNGF